MEVQVISNTVQKFNGESYYLCGYYYQRKGRRLHREVWMHHNGEIPTGYHVHHADGDKSNNNVENLVLMKGSDHLSEHMSTPERKERSRALAAEIRELTKEWHGSEAGKAWHSEHGKDAWAKRDEQTYTCMWCGKEFQTKRMYGKDENCFCSANCKQRHRYHSGVDNVERVCPTCGKVFVTNRYNKAKACSPWCSRRLKESHES